MKKIGILASLLLVMTFLGAEKLNIPKYYKNLPQRQHPYEQLLNKQPRNTNAGKSVNYNKLLVILVDFQEETTDDPNTTGNGKFLLEADPAYLYSVGSPPYNHSYYMDNMEALRYYYLAVSQGSYNLEYDVYPQTGAYTLPQTMGYYNPVGAASDLFLSRTEEYFREAFEIADSLSPEIDFTAYDHFMIIHAGSDWQHDINGDTPSDIPSFYITVDEGKEAVVDNGSVLISHACNVPSTISQDFYTQTSGDTVIHGGYGALNSVIAHEFGHSLGLVDLYNVYNWQPMVGVFDIMDSGGSGVLVDVLPDNSLVMVEGALPVLPGAWSRALLFGDYFQSTGYMKDLSQIDLFTPQDLNAASTSQSGTAINPEILKLPLSENEYILVENRNVDPDGDGGTALVATEDHRVILYPTPVDDPLNTPSYEYDYLLPSFQKADGSAIGGGIMVWHVNEDVIYNQGVTNSAGEWISNFANNSVNTHYSSRGVEIIEADNLPDIGYNWSWYWTGTQYEYFHKYKPVLDGSGNFVNWSLNTWKPELSNETAPSLMDSNGLGSQYWLSDIGNPAATMNVTVRSGFFSHTQTEDYGDLPMFPGPAINSSFSDLSIPLISEDSIRLLSNDGTNWTDLMGAFPWEGQPIDYPVINSDQNGNGFKELVMVHGNALELVEFANDLLTSVFINYPDTISTTPISLDDTLYVSTQSGLSSVRDNTVLDMVSLDGVKRLGSFGNELVALSSDILYRVDRSDLHVIAEIELPELFGSYEPVSFTAEHDHIDMLFLMADSGNVYKYQDSQLQQVFLNTTQIRPTQMGITWYNTGSSGINPVVFWACGSRIYAIKHDGTLLSGYPYNAFPLIFTPEEHVYAMISNPQIYLYLPVRGKGHVAFTASDGILWQSSLISDQEMRGSHLLTGPPSDSESTTLYWYYTDAVGRLFIQSKSLGLLNNGIYWNGFRNGGSGCFSGFAIYDETPSDPAFDAYVYPNPVRNDKFRVKIENFTQTMKIDLYDVNATLLKTMSVPANGISRRDIQLDSSKLSSGVYILSLQCGDQRKRLKFAVEK